MAEREDKCYENSIENARQFLNNQDKRKSPNNRVNDSHYFEIANVGARRLREVFASQEK